MNNLLSWDMNFWKTQMRKNRFNLNQVEQEQKNKRRADLIEKKQKVYLNEEWSGYCDNTDHPLFSIKVTVDKPWAACYYCSKLWILGEKKDG